jgi:signal transduction histidine kinase
MKDNYNKDELLNLRAVINGKKHLVTNSGALTPVSISCSVLKSDKDGTEGLIIVGHDLSEQFMVEEKLDQLRRERLIAINEAQEEERMRIATDLHDGLGQMLTSISYAIQEFSEASGESSEKFAEISARIQDQIDAAIREAKSIAHDLIPIVLKDFGLIVAIENLIRKANELHDVKFQFSAFDFNERIDPKLEKALYRICQESMNNILKHANAKNAMLQVLRQKQAIVLVIEDDGGGFIQNAEGDVFNSGIGLISIKERVRAFNGTFTINSSPDFGTEIIIEIPCRKL